MVGLIKAKSLDAVKKPRNYKREYRKFHSSQKAIAERSSRNKARRLLTKLGRVKKGDRRDIHHVNRRPTDNRRGNLRVVSRGLNRSIK